MEAQLGATGTAAAAKRQFAGHAMQWWHGRPTGKGPAEAWSDGNTSPLRPLRGPPFSGSHRSSGFSTILPVEWPARESGPAHCTTSGFWRNSSACYDALKTWPKTRVGIDFYSSEPFGFFPHVLEPRRALSGTEWLDDSRVFRGRADGDANLLPGLGIDAGSQELLPPIYRTLSL